MSAPTLHASTAPPLQAVGLSKRFGDVVALDDVSFTLEPGEALGLLGPNGAGKTTTVKILAGLTRPTAGEAWLFGLPATLPAARRSVGYLPELFRFPDWMTARAVCDLHARLAGLAPPDRAARATEALELVGLAERADGVVRSFSKGMSQRLGLAVALVARPALVLLDEPTSALDPLGRRMVRDVISQLTAGGVAVLLNSHLLVEVESVCQRVVVLDRGAVRFSGHLRELVRSVVELAIEVDRVDAALVALLSDRGVIDSKTDTSVLVRLTTEEDIPEVAAAVVDHGYRLFGLTPRRRSLEDAYVGLVSEGEQ